MLVGTQEIGMLQQLPAIGNVIGLAGYAWKVISVDERRRSAYVERTKDVAQVNWLNMGNVPFHQRVMARLRQVLQEEVEYSYLPPLALKRLAIARELAGHAGWLNSCVVSLKPGCFALFPWAGSRVHKTLAHILKQKGWLKFLPGSGCYYMEIVYTGNTTSLLAELKQSGPLVPELVETLVTEMKASELWQGKYDYLAPRSLLEKAYMNDELDIPGTMQWLAICF